MCQAFAQVLWSDLLAVEDVLAWATERFAGEEPLHPAGRQMLDDVRAAAEQLRDELVGEGCEVELPEQPADDTARLGEALENHIARDLAQRWRELAALDAIFADLSAEYGCATMHRTIRQAVAELRAKLLDIRERLALVAEVGLPVPTDEEMEALRAIVFSDEATA